MNLYASNAPFHYPIPSYGKDPLPNPLLYESRSPSSFSESSSSSSSSSSSTDLYAESEDGSSTARPTKTMFAKPIVRPMPAAASQSQGTTEYPPWQKDLLPYSRLLNGPMKEPGMLGRELPKWKRILETATATLSGRQSSKQPMTDDWSFALASAIIHSVDPRETMTDFTKEILWKATDSAQPLSDSQLDALVIVASKIASVFPDKSESNLRTGYRRLIADIFVGTFISAWDNVRNPEGITYHPKPTEHMVLATYRLGLFIVKLWQQRMIPNNELYDCFSILITSFKSHEHSQALHALLIHAGPNFWFSMDDGVARLLQLAEIIDGMHHRIRGTSSVLGKSRSDEDVGKQLRFIAQTCRDWVAAFQRQAYHLPALPPMSFAGYGNSPRRPPGL